MYKKQRQERKIVENSSEPYGKGHDRLKLQYGWFN
jgi:hypothetical protein